MGGRNYLEPDTEYGYEYLEAFSYAENHYMEEMYKYEQSDSDSEEERLLVRLQEEKTRYITEKCLLDKCYIWKGIGALLLIILKIIM